MGTKNGARRKPILRSRIFLNLFIFALLTNLQQPSILYCSGFLHTIDLLTTPLHRGANVSNTGPSIFLSSSSQNFPNSFTAASMNLHYSLAVSDILFLMAELDIWRCFEKGCWDPDLRRPGEFGAFSVWLRNTKVRGRSTVCKWVLETFLVNTVGWCCRLSYRYREIYCESVYSPDTFKLLQAAQKQQTHSPTKNELSWCEASTIAVRRLEDSKSRLLWQA